MELAFKYLYTEVHVIAGVPVREVPFEYEFAAFDTAKHEPVTLGLEKARERLREFGDDARRAAQHRDREPAGARRGDLARVDRAATARTRTAGARRAAPLRARPHRLHAAARPGGRVADPPSRRQAVAAHRRGGQAVGASRLREAVPIRVHPELRDLRGSGECHASNRPWRAGLHLPDADDADRRRSGGGPNFMPVAWVNRVQPNPPRIATGYGQGARDQRRHSRARRVQRQPAPASTWSRSPTGAGSSRRIEAARRQRSSRWCGARSSTLR